MQLEVLIVDDEPPARKKLRRLLEGDPDVVGIDEAGNGPQAVDAIRAGHYDLVLLDIQMPALDGFGVIEDLEGEELPAIIFVTAHDEHAIRAFEVHALDYLLKPFDAERFLAALARAKEQIRLGRAADLSGVVRDLVDEMKGSAPPLSRIMVKESGRIFFVSSAEISWIEAAGNYVKLHVGGREHLLRQPLDQLLGQLDRSRYVRVHRSHAVNLDYVREIYHWSHGDYMIVLKDGTELRLSRRYRDALPESFPL